MSRPFLKMNGLGNDFVVVETRSAPFAPTAEEVRAIADRISGVGCDQLIVIGKADDADADAAVRFWNADGEEVGACGNGTRCVGWLMMQACGRDEVVIATRAGRLIASKAGERLVSVDMGAPGLDWRDIPLAEERDTLVMPAPLHPGLDAPGTCVSMGNPHVVFFLPELDEAFVRGVGRVIERHPLFPEGVNVGFAQVLGRDRIRLKVWERGAGLTQACGTGACAALVAAARRGLTERTATVVVDGGELLIEWRDDQASDGGHVIMTGPAAVDFAGELP